MIIGKVFAEIGSYALGIILSCGPSQLFGIIKGCFDAIKLCIIHSKICDLESFESSLASRDIKVLKQDKVFLKSYYHYFKKKQIDDKDLEDSNFIQFCELRAFAKRTKYEEEFYHYETSFFS